MQVLTEMSSETIQQLARRPATKLRVRRYLKDIGRNDVADVVFEVGTYMEEFFVHKDETVADTAVRAVREVGPPPGMREKLAAEIKMMLHASRDAMRTRWCMVKDGVPGSRAHDPTKVSFDAGDGYYGEAFGVCRAMEVIGWGRYGAINQVGTLNEWFWRLEHEVLAEEHFHENGPQAGQCDHCLKRYGRDDAGRTRSKEE